MLKIGMKITGTTLLAVFLVSCSTVGTKGGSQVQKVPKLSEKCIRQVPLAVGETDSTVLKLTSQLCEGGSNATLWQQLSQRLYDVGHYAKSVEAANHTLKIQPDNAIAKDIIFRAGLKITGNGLTQIKDSSQLLNGDNLKDATLLMGQINQSVGEKPLVVVNSPVIHEPKPKYIKKTTPRKRAVSKPVTVVKKTVVKPKPVAKPASNPAPVAAPRNPFSSFN